MKKLGCVLLSALMLVAVVTGCSSAGKEKPEQVVEKALTAIRDQDKDAIARYADGMLLDFAVDKLKTEETQKLMFEKLEWKVLSTKVNGDKAEVKARISNRDVGAIAMEFFMRKLDAELESIEVGSGKDANVPIEKEQEIFVDTLKNFETDPYSTEATIYLNRSGDSWKVDLDTATQSALTAGLEVALERIGYTNSGGLLADMKNGSSSSESSGE